MLTYLEISAELFLPKAGGSRQHFLLNSWSLLEVVLLLRLLKNPTATLRSKMDEIKMVKLFKIDLTVSIMLANEPSSRSHRLINQKLVKSDCDLISQSSSRPLFNPD